MKNKIIITLILTNIMLIFILSNFLVKMQILNKKTVLKEMTESEQILGLESQINSLNKSHEEYAMNVKNNKKQIAEAITKRGIVTSEEDNIDVIVSNIENIADEYIYPEVSGAANTVSVVFNISEIRNKSIYINSPTNDCKLHKGQNKGNGNTWVQLTNFTGEKIIDVEKLISDYSINTSDYPYLVFVVSNYGAIKGAYAK